MAEVQDITPDFPQEGSCYRVKLLVESKEPEYDTIVTSLIPNLKFAYRFTARRKTRTTWTFQDVEKGTRLIYHEEFLVDEAGDDPFVQSVYQYLLAIIRIVRVCAEKGRTLFLCVAGCIGDAIKAVTLRRKIVNGDNTR